jgi:hypothetical protein
MGMDVDVHAEMEMGGNGAVRSPFACHGCGRSVCATCAVVAESRVCLQCATAGRRAGMW